MADFGRRGVAEERRIGVADDVLAEVNQFDD